MLRRSPMPQSSGFSQERQASQRQCSVCQGAFFPARPLQGVCSPRCATRKVKFDRLKEAAQVRQRREALKTRSDYIKEAQAAVNKYVRLRDHGKGCISCGAQPEARFGGAMDAGHWRSVGSAPHLRFYLPNIDAQCVKCNRHLGGNAVETRKGKVARLGLARVEAIEAMQGSPKWTVDYLQRLAKVMRKKARRLEKRLS